MVQREYTNMWSGTGHGPRETFVDYALPIPVAADCSQIFMWPASFGVVLVVWNAGALSSPWSRKDAGQVAPEGRPPDAEH